MSDNTLSAYLSAGVVALLGGGFILGSSGLDVGTARSMGPGYFPQLIGYLLVGSAALIALLDRRPATESADFIPFLSVTAAILAFAVLVRIFGFIPALVAAVVISAMGDRAFDWVQSILVAAMLSVFSWIIFVLILGLRMPPFSWPL
ncbi:tripartite tricarboxylate transporter TctB family protein [Halomonas daqingensis]|uniref:Tripartite tricarboxylate transporter TctB family protein n=1 Tax=Billgrantia desiderata TaxID=52021 RepID=A0ABS9B9Q0_9GAMM|nr:tripartite tricarboxylate transporter TctB family protein [Halomonas desiderata]MCE8044389.1 tripartite tricarboxylate transporter TctB family protein [Halomonas desiderata]MCE8048963.1 tripartite tricarboxylate transporter TctB family protein [Halomonas desiderata]